MDITREGSFDQQISARWNGGRFLSFAYQAWVADEPQDGAIDPTTLYKGRGRVLRLTLYERLAPGVAGLRRVAHYDRGWRFGRRRYGALLSLLLECLEAGRLP